MNGGRIVVKVGSSTLTDASGRIDRGFVADLTAQLAAEHRQGRDILLVTSGAIRAGREALAAQLPGPHSSSDTLPFKQAAAAIGQGRLIHTYTEAFAWRGVVCAQVLLTRDDLAARDRFLNARNTLLALLDLRVIPVVNENDTVAVDEIKFGDNDMLAALVASLVDADTLLILSDVEGLYEAPPEPGKPVPRVVPLVECVTPALRASAGGAGSIAGTGGMRTKLEAARTATEAGIRTVIARGRRENVVADTVRGESVGTCFLPAAGGRPGARKRWIAHGPRPRGQVVVNAGARQALLATGVSLLAAGVTRVSGSFTAGDLVEVCSEQGETFGRGLTNYAASELQTIAGLRSDQFTEALGYRGADEVIHRDNLVTGTTWSPE